MLAAAGEHGIMLMINWPTNWMPIYREAARMAAAGDLGRIYQVKHKGGHAGPEGIGCSEYFYRLALRRRSQRRGSVHGLLGIRREHRLRIPGNADGCLRSCREPGAGFSHPWTTTDCCS